MDEPDVIPRREAFAGLVLLGALGIALMGTIVYRIHYAKPMRATPQTQGAWNWANVAEPVAPTIGQEGEVTAAAIAPTEPLAIAPPPPSIEPIPTLENDSANVPAASMTVAPPPATAVEPPPLARPIFVAPAAR
jgi:hypothetical protein